MIKLWCSTVIECSLHKGKYHGTANQLFHYFGLTKQAELEVSLGT